MNLIIFFFCLINLINVNKGFVLQHEKQKNPNYLEDHLESNLYEDVDMDSNELGKNTNLFQLVEYYISRFVKLSFKNFHYQRGNL